MQGFQPVYSGNPLSQAYGRAGEMIVSAAQTQAQAMQSIGQSIGGALSSIGSSMAGAIKESAAANAPVSEDTVRQAEKLGVDFGPRERVDTGGGDSGIQQFKPVTQEQYNRAMKNQEPMVRLQQLKAQESTLSLQAMDSLIRANAAAVQLGTVRSNYTGVQEGYGQLNNPVFNIPPFYK